MADARDASRTPRPGRRPVRWDGEAHELVYADTGESVEDEDDDANNHTRSMTDAERLALLLTAVAPLLDPEKVQPFYSAWEFDGDGEAAHAALADAVRQVTGSADSEAFS